MTVYNEFLKDYEYRKKHYRVKEDIQKKQRDKEQLYYIQGIYRTIIIVLKLYIETTLECLN